MDDLNKKLHLAIGGHWHECKHCGDSSGGSLWDRANPRYDSSLEDAFKLVEFLRREKQAELDINADDEIWCVLLSIDGKRHRAAVNESLPRAIALAAARALEGV